MFILNILITFTVISAADIVRENNVDKVFSVNSGTNLWPLPDYESLKIVQWKQQNSKCVRSDLEGCALKVLSPFRTKYLELRVHLSLCYDTGEFKITLLNKNDRLSVTYNFPNFNKRYHKGRNRNGPNVKEVKEDFVNYSQNLIPNQKRFNQDRYQNLNQNLIENPNRDNSQNLKLIQNSNPNQEQTLRALRSIPDHNQRLNQDQMQNQNQDQTQDPNQDHSENPNRYLSQSLNLIQRVKQNQDQNQNMKLNQSESLNPDQDPSSNLDPNQNQDQSSNEDEQTLWNPFTISIVAITTSIVVAVCLVSAYHLGKIRARGNNQIISDDIQPNRIIPRVECTRRNPLYNDILRV